MTENRLFAGWLRSITALAAVAGTLGLSGCGGGSGAPNNPFLGALTVLPASTIAYSGVPTTLTISGGTGPYRAFSSDSALLPVTQTVPGKTVVLLAGNVDIDTTVTITVQDAATLQPVAAQVPVTVTVRPARLGNSLSVIPNLTECGTAICSGQTGTASATVRNPQGVPIAGQSVRFDVLGTAYTIAANTAQPFVTSLIVVTDANGVASVIIRANAGVATQYVQLMVTDLTSGQQQILNFVIQQVIDGAEVLSVVPGEATITGAFKGQCSAGFRTDYFIYGGTPPYRVTSTFPASVTLVNSIVNASGGFFEAITNGSCVDPLTFSILDATGRQTTATLRNLEGTTEVPVAEPPPALAISPAAIPATGCNTKTFQFIASGGTPSYGAIITPTSTATVAVAGNKVTISGVPASPGVYSVVVFDQSNPQKSATATITCS